MTEPKVDDFYPQWSKKPAELPLDEWRLQWNIPNWEKPQNYPKDSLSRDQWKWEFIRRNPHYRELWVSYQQSEEELCDGEITLEAFDALDDEKAASALEYELTSIHDPRLIGEDFRKVFFDRSFQGKELRKTYGPGGWTIVTSKKLESLVDDNRYKIFVYDLRFPTAPQKKHVAAALKGYKSKDRKPGMRNMLRAIDAWAEAPPKLT